MTEADKNLSPKNFPNGVSPNGSSLSLTGTPGKKLNKLTPVRQNAPIETESATNSEIEVVFLDPLEKKYECPVCCQVLRYPVQFEECGHRCCSSCLPELLRVAPRCPLDQTNVERDKCYVDKAFQRETDNLGVKCCYFQRGCTWTGILKELMSHLETCEHAMVICSLKCGVEFEKRFLEKHCEDDCPKRKIFCQFCTVELIAQFEADHLEKCGKFPVACPNGCKKKDILREKLIEHLDSKCLKQEQCCPFVNVGCEFKSLKKKMLEHVKEEIHTHANMLCDSFKESNRIVEVQIEKMKQIEARMTLQERRCDALEKLYGAQLLWKIEGYAEKVKEAKEGKKSTIFSPPFLTSRHGYKLALSACLYGDGKARGKFMSLFVCLCRGEYDALLVWPFSHRISFSLIDQCQDPEARRNITYSVKPNICKENKPFLGRPSGERNASFGAQKFAEIDVVNTLDYIRDDCIFIKVTVDSEDMIPL